MIVRLSQWTSSLLERLGDEAVIVRLSQLTSSLLERLGDEAVIVRLSGPLKECYAQDNGLGKNIIHSDTIQSVQLLNDGQMSE